MLEAFNYTVTHLVRSGGWAVLVLAMTVVNPIMACTWMRRMAIGSTFTG